MLLWNYFAINSTMEEKALIIRKLLYYIGKLSEKIYEEFIEVKEISQAHFIFLMNGKLDKSNDNINLYNDHFYGFGSILGYDYDGNPEEEE